MKKFLCYDTNDAASGKINVGVNGVLKPNSTVPSTNGAANQYLVTDDKGEVRWEDRLAYEYTGWKDFALNYNSTAGIEITGFTMPPVGDTVTVKVDGVESVETVTLLKVNDYRYIRYIGRSPLEITQGAPGWSIAWHSEDEQVFGIAKVPTTVSLPVTEQHKIDQKFIPHQTVYVNATGGNDANGDGSLITNVTLDKTYDEIIALLSRGVDVKIIRENVILDYLSFNKEEGIIFLAYYPFGDQVTLGCAIRPDNSADVVVSSLADSFLPIDINGELVAPLILKSGTPGSSKKFKITVDDSGAISATEV